MKLKLGFGCVFLLNSFSACAGQLGIARVNEMADLPHPLLIADYRQLARNFDDTVYDFRAQGEYWPLVWIDRHGDNFPGPTVGLYTSLGDIRQGSANNGGTFHEALASMGAVLGATLVGVDKSNQRHVNYVSMLKNYFNKASGWNIMQNNTGAAAGAHGGGYGRDWWYDVFPNLLFFAIYDKYPREPQFEEIARQIAEKFLAASKILDGNYHHSFFDYGKMAPATNWICEQPDAAAGHSWVLYAAYKKFSDRKYLTGAVSALRALEANPRNPSYEVLMPFGAYLAARLNAEQGESFDVSKMLSWSFDGDAACRKGWGVLAGRWNGFDISGLVGNTRESEAYGFVMNTYAMAWPLVPLVRYDQRYAASIGKWMLNAANAVKLAYPAYAAPGHQTLPELAALSKGVIAYEGIVKKSAYPQFASLKAPVAQGDGPNWVPGNPPASQFGVYGSAYAGIFGGIIRPTGVEGILQLDLLATDFFHDEAFPTYLYFNPYGAAKRISIALDRATDLYDTVRGKYIREGAMGLAEFEIPGRGAAVIVLVPHGGKVTHQGARTLVNGVVIDYRSRR